MGRDFDPEKDKEALLKVSRPSTTDIDKLLLEQERRELEAARAELRARAAALKKQYEDEKEEWLVQSLLSILPEWAVNWAIRKGRGWLLRIFRVTWDVCIFDASTEVHQIRRAGKTVAIKLFRFGGANVEGKSRK